MIFPQAVFGTKRWIVIRICWILWVHLLTAIFGFCDRHAKGAELKISFIETSTVRSLWIRRNDFGRSTYRPSVMSKSLSILLRSIQRSRCLWYPLPQSVRICRVFRGFRDGTYISRLLCKTVPLEERVDNQYNTSDSFHHILFYCITVAGTWQFENTFSYIHLAKPEFVTSLRGQSVDKIPCPPGISSPPHCNRN